MVRQQQQERDRHRAFLAYQLGFAGAYFPLMSRSFWRTADLADPVPEYLDQLYGTLRGAVESLAGLLSRKARQLGEQAVSLADSAWGRLQAAWGGEVHHRNISRRDVGEPEDYDPVAMLAGGPFDEPIWTELETALAEIGVALPDELTSWVALGRVVARVLDPREEGRPGLAHIPAVVNQLSALRGSMLNAPSPRLSQRTREEVLRLHDLLLERLAGGEGIAGGDSAGLPSEGVGTVSDAPVPPMTELEKEALAIHYLITDPGRSQREIARLAGCNRGSLYRMEIYQAVRVVVARQARRQVRRGSVHRQEDGSAIIDGVDDHAPDDDVDD